MTPFSTAARSAGCESASDGMRSLPACAGTRRGILTDRLGDNISRDLSSVKGGRSAIGARLSPPRRQSGRKRLSDRRRLRRQPVPHRAGAADERMSRTMSDAFICDYVRTPIGRYGGALASVRADDLAAFPIRELFAAIRASAGGRGGVSRLGQSGRRGQPQSRAHGAAARGPPRFRSRARRSTGSAPRAWRRSRRRRARSRRARSKLAVAGGSESMTRAPLVMGKAEQAFQRSAEVFDTTIGWRFVNPRMKALYGVDSMPETAQNVADEHQVSREDQDAFALRSQRRTAAAQAKGHVRSRNRRRRGQGPQGRGRARHEGRASAPRRDARGAGETPRHRPPGRQRHRGQRLGDQRRRGGADPRLGQGGETHGLTPIARVLGYATAGVAPRVMGVGPIPAVRKLCERLALTPSDFDVVELNEAFASQALACLRGLGSADDSAQCQSERRGDRARPSARHVGRAHRGRGGARA